MKEKERTKWFMGIAKEAFTEVDHLEIAQLIRAAIQPVIDKGSSMDSGGSSDNADLWFTVGGVEYYANIRRSNAQLERDAQNAKR